MSRMVYATQIRCDWIPCETTGQVPDDGHDQWKARPPEGWASFMPGIRTYDGMEVHDFCPVHSALSILDLATFVSIPKVTA